MSRSMTETRPKFEEYSEKYADRIHMERRDGVIELRMHTDGGPASRFLVANEASPARGLPWREYGIHRT